MASVRFLGWTGLAIGSGFFLGTAWATNPTIPLDDLVQRSNLVAVAKIVSARAIAKAERDAEGNWKPARQRISAKVSKVLKAQFRNELEFDVGPLTFEPGHAFILFLQDKLIALDDEYGRRNGVAFEFVESPARRLEATDANIEEVADIMRRQR